LQEKYTTTDKIGAWGKVVLIKFSENTHNVELLPAYEKDDSTFIIPNSENGGSWDRFNPRKEIDAFQSSNQKTNGLTADLTRMAKAWVNNTASCDYKSFVLLNDVIDFLSGHYKNGADYSEYSILIKDFFHWLEDKCDSAIKSYVQTALHRAEKAYDFEKEEKPKEASEEWRKIFGSGFPLVTVNPVKNADSNTRVFSNPSAPYGYY
jgi:hypothetical protein